MKDINVINSQGIRGTIPFEDWGEEAMSQGYRLSNPEQPINVINPQGTRGTIPMEDWVEASKQQYTLPTPDIGDYAQAFVGGAAQKIGKLADVGVATGNAIAGGVAQGAGYLAEKVGAADTANNLNQFADESYGYAKDYWQNPKIEQQAAKEWDTGFNNSKGIDYASAAGNAVPDIGILKIVSGGVKILTNAGGIAKMPWVQKLNTFLETPINPTTVASFAGAGAGGAALKSDNPDTSEIENISREVAGGILGGVTTGIAMQKSIKAMGEVFTNPAKYLKSPIKTYQENEFIKKYGGDVNADAVASAEKLGLPLTPELVSNNPNAVFLANNKLKSAFVDEAYKELNNTIDQKIIKELEDKVLDKIGTKVEGSNAESAASVASSEAKDAISTNFTKWKAESKDLYDYAKQFATEERIRPNNALKIADDLIADLSFGSKELNTPKAKVREKLQLFKQEAENGMGVRDLIGWKQDLYDLGGESQSYQSLLTSLGRIIDDEINSYVGSGKGTKEFINAWKSATDFNRDVIQNIVKTDAANKIIRKELPVEAVNYMNNKAAVRDVAKMINNNELMGRLKRTAFEKQLYDRNIITQDLSLRATTLERFLNKEQDFVVSLINNDGYRTLKEDFLPYIKQRNQSKGVINNPSGTAYVTRDDALSKTSENLIPYSVWGALAVLATTHNIKGALLGGAAGAASGIKAKVEINAIKRLSKMATDQKLMQEMIKKGKEVKSEKGVNPAIKYEAIKGTGQIIKMNNNFDKNKFLEESKKWDDRSSFILTPEEMRGMRENKRD